MSHRLTVCEFLIIVCVIVDREHEDNNDADNDEQHFYS